MDETSARSTWGNFKGFLDKPYEGAENMDLIDWFMFIGLLLVILILWNIILKHIAEAI